MDTQPQKKQYTIMEVQNGFLIWPGFDDYDRGSLRRYSDNYVAKDIEEVGSILKKLQAGKEVKS